MQYRIGRENGKLKPEECSLQYSQLGGNMSYAADVELPDLTCPVCKKPLQLLLQYVSQKSSDSLHRVVYVLFCNSKHYKESIRVLTYNKNIQIEEKDTEQTTQQVTQSTTTSQFDEDIDLGELMTAVQTMG